MRLHLASRLQRFDTFKIIALAGKYPKITADDVNNLRIDIRKARDVFLEAGDQPLIGSVVRLAFHDCIGQNILQNKKTGKGKDCKLTENKCNGCFDFDEPDNAGLEDNAFNILEDIYQGITCDAQWNKKMSRADFWMAAGKESMLSFRLSINPCF